jgi:hypothetical protein
MSSIGTFIDARNRASSRRIEAISMAGHHLAYAHGTDNMILSALHLDLADHHARTAVMWERVYDSYNAAVDTLNDREQRAKWEARELELARGFHAALDELQVAA